MRTVLSFSVVALFLQFSKNVHSADYKLHVAKAYSCDNSNKTYVVKEITINQYNDQSYVTVVVDLLQDLHMANMSVQIDKCDLSGENCNALGKFTIKDLCNIIFMKNAIWSSVMDAISPRPECPNLKKNTYVMQNSTINMNDIVKVYADSTKHYWKIQGTLNDMENKPVACGTFEGTAKAF